MRAIMNWRYYVLVVALMLSVIGLFGIPSEDSNMWFVVLVGSKLGGVAAIFLAYKMFVRWAENGRVPELMSLIVFIMND